MGLSADERENLYDKNITTLERIGEYLEDEGWKNKKGKIDDVMDFVVGLRDKAAALNEETLKNHIDKLNHIAEYLEEKDSNVIKNWLDEVLEDLKKLHN